MEYIPIPSQISANLVQTIYARRQHQSIAKRNQAADSDSEDEDDADRTVFVANLPSDTTEDNIRDICKASGDVVLDEYVPQGGRHGLITLVDASSASRFSHKAKKLGSKKASSHLIKWDQYGPKGAEGYLARHYANFPSEADLQEKVDEYMESFAEQELQDQLEAEEAAQKVDADGFRLVVYKGRKRSSDIPDASEVVKPKKRSSEKTDFYRFQSRERQKSEMTDLSKRYQADKEKVEQLKQQRKFRPY